MPRKLIDISIPLQNDVPADPPGYGPSIRYFDHKQTAHEVCEFFPGLHDRGTARRRRLGDRVDQALDPQRHASRRAVSFRLDHGPRQARHHHRRGAAGMVPAARRSSSTSGISPTAMSRPRKDVEAELKRIGHTLVAARHRGGQHQRRRGLRQARLRRHRLRHGPRGDALSAGARRARHRHRRLELGRAVRPHQGEICARPTTPA